LEKIRKLDEQIEEWKEMERKEMEWERQNEGRKIEREDKNDKN
jgi:hypothetical protein